jgi:phosphoribosylaminoimidazolecarboxamide formyltransferase/IMP cyclohydrolase
MAELRRIARALISVSDKTGSIEFARGLVQPRRRARLHRRHRQGDQGRRPQGQGCFGADRLSRDDGRPGQDAASQGARRLLAIRDNRNTPAAMGTHGIRPIDLLVVNLYPVRGDRREGRPATTTASRNIDIGGRR